MNSGTSSASHAHSTTDRASVHPHSPASPHTTTSLKRRSSSPSSRPKSSGSSHARKRIRTSDGASNGDALSEPASGNNDSEAETVHLSDQSQEKEKTRRRAVKKEPSEHLRMDSATLIHRHDLPRSRPDSRASSVATDSHEPTDRKSNGLKHRQSSSRNGVARSTGTTKARALRDEDRNSSRAGSAEAYLSSTHEKSEQTRSKSSHEGRKRKLSDIRRPARLDASRQKPRFDDSLGERRHSPGIHAQSPPVSASSARMHRRSASTQSHLPKPPLSAPPRPRRDTQSNASDERRDWESDFSSDAGSPRPRPATVSSGPNSRSTNKSVTSPAPIGPPHKKTDKFGLTTLAKACEKGKLDAAVKAYQQSPDELDWPDNAGYTPLQKAALEGHADIVQFLLKKGCKTDCRSKNGDTPLIDALENGHVDVVQLLLEHGINPHHQNEKGQRAIDLVESDDEDCDRLKSLLHKAMKEYEGPESEDEVTTDPVGFPAAGERKDLLHKEANIKNLLHYAQRGDLPAVDHFLNMRVRPDINCCIVAARGGHEPCLNLLLVDMPDKDPDPADHPETPLIAAIGRGHIRVIKLLLRQEEFNPCRKTRDGKVYWQLAEERAGPKWQMERDLLKEKYDQYMSSHGGKPSKKKQRTLQDSPRHRRTASSTKADVEAKPTAPPKLAKSKSSDNRPDKADRGKKDHSAQENEIIPRRKKSLITKRLKEADFKPRRRRVVDEDSSPIMSDEDEDVRAPPSNVQMRRKSSTGSRSSLVIKGEDETMPPPARQKAEKREKTIKLKISRRSPSTSPVSERRKSLPGPKSTKDRDHADVMEICVDAPRKPERHDVHIDNETVKDSKLEAEKAAREEAEKARLAAEAEAARLKAKEDEERANEERRRAEAAALRARQARLAAVPPALRQAMEKGADRPLRNQITGKSFYETDLGIEHQFLPIVEWPLADIDTACTPDRREDKYMLSHQVVGLLGLPELDLAEFPDMPKLAISDEQRDFFVRTYPPDRLASNTYIDEFMDDVSLVDSLKTTAKEQLRALNPWYFVPVKDVLIALQSYPHLADCTVTHEDGMTMRPLQKCATYEEHLRALERERIQAGISARRSANASAASTPGKVRSPFPTNKVLASQYSLTNGNVPGAHSFDTTKAEPNGLPMGGIQQLDHGRVVPLPNGMDGGSHVMSNKVELTQDLVMQDVV